MGKPDAPDPWATAAAQTHSNVQTGIMNSVLGNVNQITPDGTLTYEQTGSTRVNGYNIPQYTATQTFSPEQQAIYDQSKAAELNLATLANNQSGFLNEYLGQPIDLSQEGLKDYQNRFYLDEFNTQQDDYLGSLQSNLANQGIAFGSEAYDKAMGDYNDQRSKDFNRLLADTQGQAAQFATAERNQPINEITALLSGSQVSQPNFIPTNSGTIAGTDVAGIINNAYAQEAASYNNTVGGLFGLGGDLASAAILAPALSDKRAKKDIEEVGNVKGHNIYEYHFKGEPDGAPKHLGVMAHEVERKNPEAVITGTDGLKRVRYGELFGA